jgi:hypothetical protein
VEFEGTHTTSIPIRDVERLLAWFKVIGFAGMDDNYGCGGLYEGSWTITSLATDPDLEKTVRRCVHDDTTKPLIDLELAIDEIADSQRLVGLSRLRITMTRGAHATADQETCYGPCEHYTLTILGDGTVEYEGFQNVDIIGTRSDTISDAELSDLLARIDESGFFDLPRDFHCRRPGQGATTTRVALHNRVNVIERCHEEDARGRPKGLDVIEDLIEEVANSQRWTGEN